MYISRLTLAPRVANGSLQNIHHVKERTKKNEIVNKLTNENSLISTARSVVYDPRRPVDIPLFVP